MKVDVIDLKTGVTSKMDRQYARIFERLGRVKLAHQSSSRPAALPRKKRSKTTADE